MNIPYRVRRALQRTFVTLGVLAVFGLAVFAAWMLWLNRYVIYTDEGAKLNFDTPFNPNQGILAQPPAPSPSVPISYGNTDDLTELPGGALQKLEGFAITTDMLKKDNLAATQAALQTLPDGATVLLDVRNVQGEFYYPSNLGQNTNKIDANAVSDILKSLQDKGCYLIARFPAFRDRWYILADERTRVPYGLPLKGGNGSLWEDVSIPELSHYWLNPASDGALNFIVQIVTELRMMGFDEVVFSDFRFPNTEKIKFSGDQVEALNNAAKTLVQACASESFTVSFVSKQITLPDGRCRLYFEDVAAAEIPDLVASLSLTDPASQLVFLTDLLDTRYEAYSVLRPLDAVN